MVLCDTACFKYCKQNKMTFFQILTIISIPGKKIQLKNGLSHCTQRNPGSIEYSLFFVQGVTLCIGCYPLCVAVSINRGFGHPCL